MEWKKGDFKISDKVVFSYFMDVIIDSNYRGKGLGKWLMECMLEHPDIINTNPGLATRDAHGLYEKYGFKREEWMRKCR